MNIFDYRFKYLNILFDQKVKENQRLENTYYTPFINLSIRKLALRARRVDADLGPEGRGKHLVGKGLGTVRARLATIRTKLATVRARPATVQFKLEIP